MPLALVNGLLFNLSWLAIVYSQSSVVAPLVAAAHVLLHMRLMGEGRREWMFIIAWSLLGLLLDQLLFAAGVFVLDGVSSSAPVWFSCLWPVLATTPAHAFRALAGKPLLAALLGAAGGYGSYRLGVSLSAVDFAAPDTGPLVMAAVWFFLLPAMVYSVRLSTRFAGGAADGSA